MSASCSPAPASDALTTYLRSLVEVIDASEAATAAQGRPNANAAYDRLQSANEAMHRAFGEVMRCRASLVMTAEWRIAVVEAERARDVIWHEHDGEHTASANAGGVKVLCGVGPHEGRFLAWCVVACDGEEWASWSPMMAESVEAGKQLAEARAETTLEPRVLEGEAAGAVLKAMGVR